MRAKILNFDFGPTDFGIENQINFGIRTHSICCSFNIVYAAVSVVHYFPNSTIVHVYEPNIV